MNNAPLRIVLIGRGPGNDLVVRNPSVSAQHARLIVEADGLWLEDLDSRNGTFVGLPPRRISREKITSGDTVTLGDLTLPASALVDLLVHNTKQPVSDAGVIDLGSAGMVTFGRRDGADISIDQPLVSALHAQVSVDRGRVIVRDLGSMTGTFVDGRRVERPVEIVPGTIVQIADQRYQLSEDARSLQPLQNVGDVIEATGVAVEVGGKRLLEKVSLVVQPGEFIAIMGPSGSGKSTLLSVLNGHVVPTAGRIVVGGLDLHDHYDLFRGRIGYVPQDDILHPDLTVWQALWYAARLRLPKDTSDDEIKTRIHHVITQLGLEGTEQTRVGDQRKRGVSGGQRKRVNLAMELLTDPPILVLDEPTSGLSSTDTLSVIQLLRNLADSGKTILITIHQPSLDAFKTFDAVAVIARDASSDHVGRLAWFGRAWPDAISFFEPPLPNASQPTNADGLLRGLAQRPVIEWSQQWEQSVAHSIWVDRRAGTYMSKAGRINSRRSPRATARLTQWITLVKRTFAVKAADGWNTIVLFAQAPIVAVLIAVVFSKVLCAEPTLSSWPKMTVSMATTLFVTALAAIWFGCSSMAREVVTEWPVYRRERMVGLSILSYAASKMTVLLGIAAIQTAMLVVIVGWSCRLESSWCYLWCVLYVAALAGGAIGLFISATLRTVDAAAGILPVLLLPMIVLGGILVPLGDLPKITLPLAAAMPSRWAFEGLLVPESLAQPRMRNQPSVTVDSTDPPPSDRPVGPSSPPVLKPDVTPDSDADRAAAKRTPAITAIARQNQLGGNSRLDGIDGLPGPTEPAAGGTALAVGRGGRQTFLLPGRRKIVAVVESAAAQASQEISQAQSTLESEVSQRGADMQSQMKREMERKLQAAQADFAKQAAQMNAATEKTLREASEAMEQKLRDMQTQMQKQMEDERARMTHTLNTMGLGTERAIVLSQTPMAAGDIDMAEQFFSRSRWRSKAALPLAVLASMFIVGITATGAMLRYRDASGR